MKTIYLAILFILSTIPCWSKGGRNTSNTNGQFIQIKIKQLGDSVTYLNSEIHTIQTENKQRNVSDDELKKSIKTAEELIDKENILVNGYVFVITAITLLVVLASLFGYYFQIKPLIKDADTAIKRAEGINDKANEKIEKLDTKFYELHNEGKKLMEKIELDSKILIIDVEKDLDKRIQESLSNTKQQQIDQAIVNVSTNDSEFKDYALGILRSIQPHEFKETQLFKISTLLKGSTVDNAIKWSLLEIMAKSKNVFSDEYFTTIPIISTDRNIRHTAIMYFKDNDIKNYLVPISKMILDSTDPPETYILISGWLSSGFTDKLIPIINFEQLQSQLTIEQLKPVLDILLNGSYREIEEKIKESALYKKVMIVA